MVDSNPSKQNCVNLWLAVTPVKQSFKLLVDGNPSKTESCKCMTDGNPSRTKSFKLLVDNNPSKRESCKRLVHGNPSCIRFT